MTENALVDRLDRALDTILLGGDATAAFGDPELGPLARLAADLRHYPSPEFKARLRSELERKTFLASRTAVALAREGFAAITPYLRVRETGILGFLASVFGAYETESSRGSDGAMHREVRIGDSILRVSEGGPEGAPPFRPAEFHVYVEDADAAFERALAAGATSLGEPADRPYGERAGFVRDPFGNHWFIATHLGGGAYLPQGLSTVTPFLHAESAARYIGFLKRAFGAVEEGRHDAPGGRVVYARLRIAGAAIELGEADGPQASMPGGFYLHADDAESIHERALAAGAKSLPAPTDPWSGDRVRALEDPMGNHWFITR